MKVTTGGISVVTGVLIVSTLSVAAVMTVRDENDTSDETVECQPQPSTVAEAAVKAFVDEYAPRPGSSTAAGQVSLVVSSDAVRERFREAGSLPDWSDRGYVVVVGFDPTDPEPPACFDDTPIVYVDSDWILTR